MNNQMTEQERQFYFVQHKFLPHLFYSGSKPFVKRILTLGGDSFVDLLCAMNDDEESDEEYTCPYIASDFAVKDVHKGEDFTITQVLMPDASISPLCRCIYFAYSSDWKERFVYTVERSPEDTYLLCGWGEDESHMIFEIPTPDDPKDEIQKVVELFESIDDYKNLGEKLKAQIAHK